MTKHLHHYLTEFMLFFLLVNVNTAYGKADNSEFKHYGLIDGTRYYPLLELRDNQVVPITISDPPPVLEVFLTGDNSNNIFNGTYKTPEYYSAIDFFYESDSILNDGVSLGAWANFCVKGECLKPPSLDANFKILEKFNGDRWFNSQMSLPEDEDRLGVSTGFKILYLTDLDNDNNVEYWLQYKTMYDEPGYWVVEVSVEDGVKEGDQVLELGSVCYLCD